MLPFFNMRLYRNGNMAILQPFIDRMKKGELTLENILEEDEIIQDLKSNPNSQFINMLSNEAIRKLIDYATKMPKSDERNVGYKYPFNATEILCCDNNAVMEKIMNEIRMGEDSDDEEEEKEEKENGDFIEVKEDENKGQEPEGNNDQTQNGEQPQENQEKVEANTEEPKQGEEQSKVEEPKQVEDQPKTEEQTKTEEPKKEEEEKPKEEEPKKEEEKPKEAEPKKEGEEPKIEEPKKEEDQAKSEAPKKEDEQPKVEEPKKEEQKLEEAKPEEPKPEEPKPEEPKPEEPKPEEPKKEVEDKHEEDKPEEPKKGEAPLENAEEQKKEEEVDNKKTEEENDEQKQEENDAQKQDEENEKEEEQEKEDEEAPREVTIIYDNVDYLLGFLNESEETKSNYVLVGYFYKIVNHLINSQSSKIIQYLFDYPKKMELDVLGLIIKNMKRKSMGELVNKLLLFQEEGVEDFLPKKLELLEKVLEELKETTEEDKYQCICYTLENTFYNKSFFVEFMKEPKFLDLLYAILEKSQDNSKKLISVLRLLINIHENILKNVDERITISVAQENPMDFLSMFNGTYGMDETGQKEMNQELQQIVEKLIQNLINLIEKSKFNFMNDFDDYSSPENSEFMSTYQISQKKLGMKKLAQLEFFRTILDLLINAYAKFDVESVRESIKNIINNAQEKKLFWKMHKLFFDFPFCNLYQSLYFQIFDIILNEHCPEELVKNVFIEKEGDNKKNIIEIFIDKVIKEMEFKYTSGRISFHPNYSFEVSILNKINASNNEYIKALCNDSKNLIAFDKILGQEIDTIFNQKLLLNPEKDIQMGPNIPLEKEEAPLKYFGKKNFMELLEENNSIYSIYLKGDDYEPILEEKKQRLLKEEEERKKAEEKSLMEGTEDEMVPGLGDSINMVGDNDNNENDNMEKEEIQKHEEEEVKDKPDTGTEEEITEESEEDKSFNDVNFWKPQINPDDNIMSAILHDLD